MKNTFATTLLAVGLLVPAANAQSLKFPSKALKVNGPTINDLANVGEDNGVLRLRKSDEAHTNEQADIRLFPDGVRGLYVEMRTSELAGTLPVHRVQGACTPIQLTQDLDGSVTATKLAGERWVTNNVGNEYRNAHHPFLVPLGANTMLYTYNFQIEGTTDTKRYAQILDNNCNAVPMVSGTGTPEAQVVIMEKTDDDCSMNEDGGGADFRVNPDGSVRVVMWAGCNGNGKDDGWLNAIDVTCDVAQTLCTITKQFDVSLAQREERSRGRCSMSSADPDTAICTWTEGNNQPQRDGTWIAGVDVSGTGRQENDGKARIIWKKLIEGRKALPTTQSVNPIYNDPDATEEEQQEMMEESLRSYSSRAKHARILTVDGTTGNLVKSDLVFVSTGDLVGSNRNDRKGGRYIDARLGVARVTRAGLVWVVPMTSISNQMVGIDYTHIKMTGVLVQNDDQVLPGVTFLQGSHNGGGTSAPDVKVFAFLESESRLVDYGTYKATGVSYDRHMYSNYLGNNPGNQGRNFAGATLVKNPFVGVNGSRSKFLVLHALTGKDPSDVTNPALKPSSYVSLMELILDGPPPAPVVGLESGSGSTPKSSSCSTVTGEGGALLGLLYAVHAFGRRRRRSSANSVMAVLPLCLLGCGNATIPGDPLNGDAVPNYIWVGLPAGSSGGPAPPSAAKPQFDQDVAPILTASCAGSECHSAPGTSPIRFMPSGGEDLYSSILVYAERLVAGNFDKGNAQMLTRIAGGHYTASYSASDVTLIEQWLDAEVAARLDLPGLPSVTRRMMSEMSGCMTLSDWNEEGVAVAWAMKETDEGRCQQCHLNGQGWLATQDSNHMFNVISGPSTNPATGALLMEYLITSDLSDPAAPKLVINRALLERAGNGNAQHPLYEVDGDAMDRLERFYFKTVERRATFACASPRFEP